MPKSRFSFIVEDFNILFIFNAFLEFYFLIIVDNQYYFIFVSGMQHSRRHLYN